MALGKIKKMLSEDIEETTEDEYYNADNVTLPSSGKMILLEPRAFSESQQIADHLKKRNTVVVNMKRVTAEHAKRIIDFLSGKLTWKALPFISVFKDFNNDIINLSYSSKSAI